MVRLILVLAHGHQREIRRSGLLNAIEGTAPNG